jgi:uncharacterized BrkB/YihY/UPF0761 family membrane protein
VQDIINAVIFMAVVFGLAALALVFLDKITLRGNMSAEEREAAIAKRSNRLHGAWAIAFFMMAVVALPLHVFGIEQEPLWQRLLYGGLAALVIISLLSSWYDARSKKGNQNRQAI